MNHKLFTQFTLDNCDTDDPQEQYWCSLSTLACRFTKLMKYCRMTQKYPIFHKKVEKLLKTLTLEEINATNSEGHTALTLVAISAKCGSTIRTLKLLLDYGADTNIMPTCGISAFMLACRNAATFSSTLAAKILINYGADEFCTAIDGLNALSCATVGGDDTDEYSPEIIKLLINVGFDIERKDPYHRTPLMRAAKYCTSKKGCTQAIKLLLEYGADTSVIDYCGNSFFGLIIASNAEMELKAEIMAMHVFIITLNEGDGEKEVCMVCMNDGCNCMSRCGHMYHKDCLIAWLMTKNKCVVCTKKMFE